MTQLDQAAIADTAPAYATLFGRFRRMALVGDARGMLRWDRATLMPEGSSFARTEQIATLEEIGHEMMVADDMADLLDQADAELAATDPGDWHSGNAREMRRQWLHQSAVPADLVTARTRACAACELAWRAARPANDYKAVLGPLREVLRLTRELGAAKADRLGTSLYDALLDQFEPDGRAEWIDELFAPLVAALPDLTERVLTHQGTAPDPMPLPGPFPVAAQEALGRRFMEALGFSFERGRLDVSLHPFCGGVPDDIRITTRFDEADFTSALMGVLHETGHALYEAGLPAEWRYQPVGRARGLGLHESQSLFVEMQICRSLPFMRFAAPLIREGMDGTGPAWEAGNLHRRAIRVERGFIRVDADEVTYPAHVILRYRLERAILAGDLDLADLPGAWSDGMAELLGVRPPDDRLGCLQDIHWYDGVWGYFPTYTMGAIAAAQLFAALRRAEPDIDTAIEGGDFAPALDWLRANVHAKGSLVASRDLIAQATGKPLDATDFLKHLETRYLS